MNHVSLDLSKGLASLSGWEDTPDLLVKFALQDEPIKLPNLAQYGMDVTTLSGKEEWRIPYYDVSYLLKMLPSFLVIGDRPYFLGIMAANTDEDPDYVAAYYHYQPAGPNGMIQPFVYNQQKAKSPEDALAKLAFHLFLEDKIWKIPTSPSTSTGPSSTTPEQTDTKDKED